MTVGEFHEWIAFREARGPFGDVRGDMHSALIASILAETNRDSQRRPAPFSPADFMLRFGPDPASTSSSPSSGNPVDERREELREICRQRVIAMSGGNCA